MAKATLPRRRRTIPLILLISLTSLSFLFLSHYKSSLQSPKNPSKIQSFPPNFTFTIKVLAFNRLNSLKRCLKSISRADYGKDRVNLHIFIDHFSLSHLGNDSISLSRRILEFVDEFEWIYGEKIVHFRTGNVGLQAQWLEAWWPNSDDDFAFVVEDDLELSSVYYKFLKILIMGYYYNGGLEFRKGVFGVSLQRPRFVPGKHGNKLSLENGTRLFLYQLVGTWGQLLFPRPWKEFRLWYDEHKSKGIPPVLEGMVTNGWYKRMGEKIWTPWFIKFVHSRGYFNIYTNFEGQRSLSVSHRDAGVNYGKTAGPDSILLNRNSIDLAHWQNPPIKSLKWYNFCFSEVHQGRIIRTLDQLGFILNSVQKQGTVIIVSLFNTPKNITQNLLCHFQRINISNYIILGASSALLVDLARTGHAVVDSDRLLVDLKAPNSKAEFSLKSHVLKRSLELGLDTWLIDGGRILPVIDFSTSPVDSSVNFSASSEAEILHGRGSASSARAWTDIIDEVIGSSESRSFVTVAGSTLEKRGVRTVMTGESPEFGLTKLGDVSSLEEGKKFLYWTTPTDDVVASLVNAGAWLIDGDSSCIAVYCHRS